VYFLAQYSNISDLKYNKIQEISAFIYENLRYLRSTFLVLACPG